MSSSDATDQFRTYKNVYRQPLIWGIPMKMSFLFGGIALVMVLIATVLLISGVWHVALGVFAIIIVAYFAVTYLVKKYGAFFFDKLLAYHFQDRFRVVRINRWAINLCINPRKDD